MSAPTLIPLLAADGAIRGYAIVDGDDHARLSAFTWRVSCGYAIRRAKSKTIGMHRQILGLEHGDRREVDHINRNPLDNRRVNLRIVTHAENHQNMPSARGSSSRFRGVTFYKRYGSWKAEAKIQGQRYHLGYFATEEEAAAAVAAWRRDHMPFAVEEAVT